MARRTPAGRPPDDYDPDDVPRFAVTVDVVILTVDDAELKVLLVRRGGEPHRGAWALPGGFKRPDETLDEAAARELSEETGVEGVRRLTQFGTYGDPERDPRMNVVTVAYLAVLADVGRLTAGTDADDAALWPVAEVIDGRLELAFDHRRIVGDAVRRAGTDLETSDLATAFVGPEFTLSELRAVYEAVWSTRFDAANFRRTLLSEEVIEPTGRWAAPGSEGGRPPELYRASALWDDRSPVSRPRAVESRATPRKPRSPALRQKRAPRKKPDTPGESP